MFAVSFLLIFYVVSIFLLILSIVIVARLIIDNDSLPKNLRQIIGIPILVFLSIGAILVFIDFFTQGYLKKKKWLSKIYFPFYWVFSYITLTFLYRPLVYNFLDNKFTRRISFFLVPSYIAILFLISFKNSKTNYLESAKFVSETYINDKNYEDLLIKDDDFAKIATIQSKVIRDPYLKVFKVFNENLENQIYNFHPLLKPKKDRRGLSTDIIMFDSTSSLKERDSLLNKYLEIFNKTHQVYIDSVKFKSSFLISVNKKTQKGFEAYIGIKNISEGKHILQMKRLIKKKTDTILVTDINIPFWYYKNN